MSSTSFKDITGKTYGNWEVLKYLGNSMWECRCKCENHTIRNIKGSHLILGKTTSCGCLSGRQFKDLTGQIFGSWKAIEYLGGGKWKCECQCDKHTIGIVSGYDLRYGKSKSCGKCNLEENLIGKSFGNWIVLSKNPDNTFKCECQCTNKTIKNISRYHLISGQSKSCGCLTAKLRAETMYQRYGDISSTRIDNPRTPEQIAMVKDRESLISAIKTNFDNKPTLFELSKFLDMSVANTSLTLHNFNILDAIRFESYSSRYETEIIEYIRELNPDIEIITHNRSILSGQELDIYLPEYRLAIEFNGTFWHSSIRKDRFYHQNKTIACANQRIRLIHIFEHEWNNENTQEIIKNILKMKLRPNDNYVVAGKRCNIHEISVDEARTFIAKYHLQGYSGSDIRIGLLLDSELIGVMTFGKPRFKSNCEYELIRIAWKPGIVVVGGSEKMFRYFINNYHPKSIVSYCDISKFIGTVYYKLGFKSSPTEKTKPNYNWINLDNKILTRYQTMKQSLIDKGYGTLGNTEDEIMLALGYFKVYDSGNLRFTWYA